MSKFTQYEAFVATVNTGSISMAAESLNRTPSAISKHITNLESSLRVQLFDRSSKKMIVTAQGERFYKMSSSILRQIKAAESQVDVEQAEISGPIKITLSASLIGSSLMDYLNEFAELYGATHFEIQCSEHVESFSECALDFAFRIGKVGDSSHLVARELKQVRPIFYATPQYLARHGKPMDVSQLDQHRIAFPPLQQLSSDVRKWLKEHGVPSFIKTQHQVDDLNAIRAMTLQHGCIGFDLDESLLTLLQNDLVEEILPDHQLPSKALHLIYRKVNDQAPQLQTFKQFMLAKYKP